MVRPARPRPLRRSTICLVAGCCALWSGSTAAQGIPPFVGFAPLPSFAWPRPAGDEESRWAGSYARMSAGYEAVSSKRFGGYAGPIVGFEGGRMWQEGRFVYGIAGGFDALAGAGATPRFGRLAYSRDVAGALSVQAGMLLAPDVLLYGKAGGWAVHEQLRVGATSLSPSFARDEIAIQPDARVGVEWAITDRLSVAVEAGATRGGPRW